MREAKARLPHLPCAIPGCTKNRLGVAQYCHAHAGRPYTYGHPQGIPIPRDIYSDELQEVRDLFNANKDHPGRKPRQGMPSSIVSTSSGFMVVKVSQPWTS